MLASTADTRYGSLTHYLTRRALANRDLRCWFLLYDHNDAWLFFCSAFLFFFLSIFFDIIGGGIHW